MRSEMREAVTDLFASIDWTVDPRELTPTESETLAELDRFCNAMLHIRSEIDRVASGEWTAENGPLHFAPHTAEDLLGEWDRVYPRDLGAFPVASLRGHKYFPPVSRIDSAFGDRNLICSCEPLESFAMAQHEIHASYGAPPAVDELALTHG